MSELTSADEVIQAVLWSMQAAPAGSDQKVVEQIERVFEREAKLQARVKALEENIRWQLNVASGIGKSGGDPYAKEWKDAYDEAKQLLEDTK